MKEKAIKAKKFFFVFLNGKYQGLTKAVSSEKAKGNVGFGKKNLRGVQLAIFINNAEAFPEGDPIPADLFYQIPESDFPKLNIPKSDGRFAKFLKGRA